MLVSGSTALPTFYQSLKERFARPNPVLYLREVNLVHEEKLLGYFGIGRNRRAVQLSKGRALLLPNMDSGSIETIAQRWEAVARTEVRISQLLSAIGLLSPRPRLASVQISRNGSEGEICAYISNSFDALQGEDIFVVEKRGIGRSVWEREKRSLFRGADPLDEKNWEPVIRSLYLDIAKIFAFEVPRGGHSLNLAIIGREGRWQARYFGFAFSHKDPSLLNLIREGQFAKDHSDSSRLLERAFSRCPEGIRNLFKRDDPFTNPCVEYNGGHEAAYTEAQYLEDEVKLLLTDFIDWLIRLELGQKGAQQEAGTALKKRLVGKGIEEILSAIYFFWTMTCQKYHLNCRTWQALGPKHLRIAPPFIEMGTLVIPFGKPISLLVCDTAFYKVRLWCKGAMGIQENAVGEQGEVVLDFYLETKEKVQQFVREFLQEEKRHFYFLLATGIRSSFEEEKGEVNIEFFDRQSASLFSTYVAPLFFEEYTLVFSNAKQATLASSHITQETHNKAVTAFTKRFTSFSKAQQDRYVASYSFYFSTDTKKQDAVEFVRFLYQTEQERRRYLYTTTPSSALFEGSKWPPLTPDQEYFYFFQAREAVEEAIQNVNRISSMYSESASHFTLFKEALQQFLELKEPPRSKVEKEIFKNRIMSLYNLGIRTRNKIAPELHEREKALADKLNKADSEQLNVYGKAEAKVRMVECMLNPLVELIFPCASSKEEPRAPLLPSPTLSAGLEEKN